VKRVFISASVKPAVFGRRQNVAN